MATTDGDEQQRLDEHLMAIRVHLLHIRRSVGILAWLAVVGVLLGIVFALTSIE
jgi:hypothetical protein